MGHGGKKIACEGQNESTRAQKIYNDALRLGVSRKTAFLLFICIHFRGSIAYLIYSNVFSIDCSQPSIFSYFYSLNAGPDLTGWGWGLFRSQTLPPTPAALRSSSSLRSPFLSRS